MLDMDDNDVMMQIKNAWVCRFCIWDARYTIIIIRKNTFLSIDFLTDFIMKIIQEEVQKIWCGGTQMMNYTNILKVYTKSIINIKYFTSHVVRELI